MTNANFTNARRRLTERAAAAGIGSMRRVLVFSLVVLPGLAMMGLSSTASAAQPGYGEARSSKSYRYSCPPPLKFAAGACVKRCPAGYRDTGRYCRFKNMSR